MKPLHPFVLSVALALVGATAHAQQRAPSEAATAEQRLVEDIGTERLPAAALPAAGGDARNVSTLIQMGAGNSASIDQRSLSNASNQAYIIQVGGANVLDLSQMGGNNTAYMSQQGSGNQANFTQDGQGNSSAIMQRGNSNRLSGLVDGNSNEVNIRQDGSNNQVRGEIHQDGRTYNINQIGHDNTLTQLESANQASKGYSIEMRGSGINLTIEQGKVR